MRAFDATRLGQLMPIPAGGSRLVLQPGTPAIRRLRLDNVRATRALTRTRAKPAAAHNVWQGSGNQVLTRITRSAANGEEDQQGQFEQQG